ncbi:hypothetical protein ENUP19_0223G0018 [Entamoeba nuttalli]|uniref:Endoplasmic reticulum-Golgi intermediate compartment protein 3 n=2 Tax=Entamoeba nuttalli TaxID=412467 RepID=K2GIJ8_ENTNP|nr:hypothetical protein ENU1_017250 [Entamoeba nuttalli P19]EKE42566.1 hypothetical protein ENU1_017250 [Entamoeba nuttalli P19]|eukprot:XP_008855098.1 hypothetical protein ENU1_017250 [Entamoeba nuttalli P19]
MQNIKRFDAYPKINSNNRVKHWIGGLLSIVCIITMIWMFSSELNDYFTIRKKPVLRVDESKNKKLPINFDITFPHSACSFTSVDVLDTTGEVIIDISKNIKKERLNLVNEDEISKKKFAKTVYGTECPPCNNEIDKDKCCFTCEELTESYQKLNKEVPKGSPQCEIKNIHKMTTFYNGEGCRISGTVFVNRASGNFHIAPGSSQQLTQEHIHSVDWISGGINLTHTWNFLSFGDSFPGMINPLDGIVKVDRTNNSMYQYFVQVVPMTYTSLDNKVINTNGYSVTEHYRPGSLKSPEQGIPGVFVIYDISSIEVLYFEEKNSFGHLLTSICGIIGGVFALFSLLDYFIFHVYHSE